MMCAAACAKATLGAARVETQKKSLPTFERKEKTVWEKTGGGGWNYLPQRLGALDQIRCHIELVEMIIPTAAVARFHLVGIVQAVKRRLRDVHAARGRGEGKKERGRPKT